MKSEILQKFGNALYDLPDFLLVRARYEMIGIITKEVEIKRIEIITSNLKSKEI